MRVSAGRGRRRPGGPSPAPGPPGSTRGTRPRGRTGGRGSGARTRRDGHGRRRRGPAGARPAAARRSRPRAGRSSSSPATAAVMVWRTEATGWPSRPRLRHSPGSVASSRRQRPGQRPGHPLVDAGRGDALDGPHRPAVQRLVALGRGRAGPRRAPGAAASRRTPRVAASRWPDSSTAEAACRKEPSASRWRKDPPATNQPAPRRLSTRPRSRSSSSALRTVTRLTANSRAEAGLARELPGGVDVTAHDPVAQLVGHLTVAGTCHRLVCYMSGPGCPAGIIGPQTTRCIQPKVSSARPYWMSTSALRTCWVTGPVVSPSPTWPPPRHLRVADRRHDRGGPAGEDLGDPTGRDAVAPLVDGHRPLLHAVPELAAQLHDRAAGDPLEDRAGRLGRDDRAVVLDEVEVHAAELLDVPPLRRVEEDHLVAALADGLLLGDQRAGVVAAGLGRAHAAATGAGVVLAQPDRDRLHALGEVRPGRRSDDHVGHVLRRAAPRGTPRRRT